MSTHDLASTIAFAAKLPAGNTTALAQDAAIARADIIVLALPCAAALAAANPTLAGKIVVDINNPVTPDFSSPTIDHTSSAAEEIQAAASLAHVVKGYTIFAGLFDLLASQTTNVPLFAASNDAAAVADVAEPVSLSIFAAEQTSGLDAARLIKPVGMLNIRLGYGLSRGTAILPQ
ncbi:MAG: oxidoreductase [Candidatus Devosia symbiotica]|nr:oxidoreductase [Candidatus Devosia symbiotica]